MNTKLLSIMAITAMCLVSCAVLIDFDESDAVEGQTVDGFTDLGPLIDTGNYEYNVGTVSSSSSVYTGLILQGFYTHFDYNGDTLYVAQNSYGVIFEQAFQDWAYFSSFSLRTPSGQSLQLSDMEDHFSSSQVKSTDKFVELIFDTVGTYTLSYQISSNSTSITIQVIDTPFDLGGQTPYINLGDSYDWRFNFSNEYCYYDDLSSWTPFYYIDPDSIAPIQDIYVSVGTPVYFSYNDAWDLSIDSSSGLLVSSRPTGAYDLQYIEGNANVIGSHTVTFDSSSRHIQFEMVVIDTDQSVDVSSIDISGQNTVSVGSQITLTAVTGPNDATDRGVDWSIVSGDSFIKRVSTTDTATGSSIVLVGVSDGVATIRATATDGSGVYKDFQVTVSTPQIVIGSTQDDVTLTTAMSFLYTVQTNVTDCQVLVQGAPWLSVSGNTISGTPTGTGDFTVTITVTKAGYLSATQTFDIHVISVLGFSNAPTSGVIVYEI